MVMRYRYLSLGVLVASSVVLGGCLTADNDFRWVGANRENVSIEGAPYHVRWIRTAGGIDFRTHRDQTFIFSPDEVLERRRTVEASMVVARRECGVDQVQAEGVTKISQQAFAGHIRCG